MGLKGLKMGRTRTLEQENAAVVSESSISAYCRCTKAGGFFFSIGRSKKMFSIHQWVLGSCLVIWSLFMVLLTLHHSFPSIRVPKCCSQKKKRIQEQRVFGVMKRDAGYIQL